MNETTEKALAKACASAVNSYSFSCEKFCDAMVNCIAWLRRLAVLEPYQVDPRNERSVEAGKIVAKALDENGVGRLPLV